MPVLCRVVEEDDVGGAPHGGGDGAVGLAGHDDFEKFGRGARSAMSDCPGSDGRGCAIARCWRIAKMISSAGARGVSTPALRNCNSELFFVEVPGQAGAGPDGTLKALARRRHSRFQAGGFFGGQMRIENEQDAAVVFAGNSRTINDPCARRLSSDVARTVRGEVIPQRVEILTAALVSFPSAPCRPGRIRGSQRSVPRRDRPALRFLSSTGALSAGSQKGNGDDSESFLAIDAALRKRQRNGLLRAVMFWSKEIDGAFRA